MVAYIFDKDTCGNMGIDFICDDVINTWGRVRANSRWFGNERDGSTFENWIYEIYNNFFSVKVQEIDIEVSKKDKIIFVVFGFGENDFKLWKKISLVTIRGTIDNSNS